MKLVGKIIIKGSLITKTGLHLGGSKSSLKIGAIDNNVIKTAEGVPYIPGSSIKGKLRSLLAKVAGSLFFSEKEKEGMQKALTKSLEKANQHHSEQIKKFQAVVADSKTDENEMNDYIIELFGYSGDSTSEHKILLNRLLVRDAFLENKDAAIFKEGFTDGKWENVIDRKTGTALNPRQTERVPVGATFGLELVYNIYDDVTGEGQGVDSNSEKFQKHVKALLLALDLLQDDGIGGNISRGYGQVKVVVRDVQYKLIDAESMSYNVMEAVELQPALLAEFSGKFS